MPTTIFVQASEEPSKDDLTHVQESTASLVSASVDTPPSADTPPKDDLDKVAAFVDDGIKCLTAGSPSTASLLAQAKKANQHPSFSHWEDSIDVFKFKFDTTHIKGYSEGNIESLTAAIQLSKQGLSQFEDLLGKATTLIDDSKLMSLVDAAYTEQYANMLRGYLLMAAGRYEQAQALFEKAGALISSDMLAKIHKVTKNSKDEADVAAKPKEYGWLGFDRATGRDYLVKRTEAGDTNAKNRLEGATRLLAKHESADIERINKQINDYTADIYIRQQFSWVEQLKPTPDTRSLLDKQAELGNPEVQWILNYVAMGGALGLNHKFMLTYLKKNISDGDRGSLVLFDDPENPSAIWFFHFYLGIRRF